MSSKSQASFEYLLVAAFITVVIVPATYMFYSYASDSAQQIDEAQINKFGREVVSTAETVYYLGHPTRIVVKEQLPRNVVGITIDNSAPGVSIFAISVMNKGIISNYTFLTDVNLEGTFDGLSLNSGAKNVLIASAPSESQPFVTINFDDSSCNLGAVAHNTCVDANDYCFNGVVYNRCTICGGC